jgi:hypothetical protein
MAKTIQRFQADISTGKPGAEVAYENFKTHRKQHILQLDRVRSSSSRQSAISEGELA